MPEVLEVVECDQRLMFRLVVGLSSSRLPIRFVKAVLGDKKSSFGGKSPGLVARGRGAATRGLVLDETEVDFLTVVTDEEIELDLEMDLEFLLRWGGGMCGLILAAAHGEGADTNVNKDLACR